MLPKLKVKSEMRLMGGCLNTNIQMLNSSYRRKITVIRIDIKNSSSAKLKQTNNNMTMTSSLLRSYKSLQVISPRRRQVSYHFTKKNQCYLRNLKKRRTG